MRLLLPAILLLAGACTPTTRELDRQADAEAGARADLDRELAGLVPGSPQSCVQQIALRSGGVKAFGDTLVYSTGGATRFVTQTTGGCEKIARDSILVTRTPGTQLCRGDIATTVSRTAGITDGSCSFGEFVPYTRPKAG